MNCSKQNSLFLGTKNNFLKCFSDGLKVNSEDVNFSGLIKHLGVYLDSQMDLK